MATINFYNVGVKTEQYLVIISNKQHQQSTDLGSVTGFGEMYQHNMSILKITGVNKASASNPLKLGAFLRILYKQIKNPFAITFIKINLFFLPSSGIKVSNSSNTTLRQTNIKSLNNLPPIMRSSQYYQITQFNVSRDYLFINQYTF
ncbi:hypothetical protein pb186bvf_013546 [Paramecium bursaria]